MSAYERWELAAAKAEQEAQERYDEQERSEQAHADACEEYAILAYDDDGDIAEVMSAFFDTHDESEWAILHDHMKQERIATERMIWALIENRTDDYKDFRGAALYRHEQVIFCLARGVDRGCLLDED
jgi:preprotein translocase subunit Sec63